MAEQEYVMNEQPVMMICSLCNGGGCPYCDGLEMDYHTACDTCPNCHGFCLVEDPQAFLGYIRTNSREPWLLVVSASTHTLCEQLVQQHVVEGATLVFTTVERRGVNPNLTAGERAVSA